MVRKMYTLVLRIDNNVDPLDGFEPLSVWIRQADGSYEVTQRVYKDGGVLIGESERYWESLSDVVGDWDRFVSLSPLR